MKKVWTVKYTVYLRESGIEKKANIGKRCKNNFIAQEKSYFLRSHFYSVHQGGTKTITRQQLQAIIDFR